MQVNQMPETIAEKNWRIVEQAKAAFAGCEWETAFKLFEESRQICLEQGWGAGVHFADDIIILLYPHLPKHPDDPDDPQACNLEHDDIKDELRAMDASRLPMHGELPAVEDHQDRPHSNQTAGRYVAKLSVLQDNSEALLGDEPEDQAPSAERLRGRQVPDTEHLGLEYARMKRDYNADADEAINLQRKYHRVNSANRHSQE
jgi:hypothetical protein